MRDLGRLRTPEVHPQETVDYWDQLDEIFAKIEASHLVKDIEVTDRSYKLARNPATDVDPYEAHYEDYTFIQVSATVEFHAPQLISEEDMEAIYGEARETLSSYLPGIRLEHPNWIGDTEDEDEDEKPTTIAEGDINYEIVV